MQSVRAIKGHQTSEITLVSFPQLVPVLLYRELELDFKRRHQGLFIVSLYLLAQPQAQIYFPLRFQTFAAPWYRSQIKKSEQKLKLDCLCNSVLAQASKAFLFKKHISIRNCRCIFCVVGKICRIRCDLLAFTAIVIESALK